MGFVIPTPVDNRTRAGLMLPPRHPPPSPLWLLLLLHLLAPIGTQNSAHAAPGVPPTPVFSFGDGLLDMGSNNAIPGAFKGNIVPYGVDFAPESGRVSNGRAYPDFLAAQLGSPLPPAYLGLRKNSSLQGGVSFASAGAGALWTSASQPAIPLPLQMLHFKAFLATYRIKPKSLRTSIFVISVGTTDYDAFVTRNLNQAPAPSAFVQSVVSAIIEHIKGLAALGARKFVVFRVPPLGCLPRMQYYFNLSSPLSLTRCSSPANALAQSHNLALEAAMVQLRRWKRNSAAISVDLYSALMDILDDSASLRYTAGACCGAPPPTNGGGQCGRDFFQGLTRFRYSLCDKRSRAVWWDMLHPTEDTISVVADWAWQGLGNYVRPYSIRKLASL